MASEEGTAPPAVLVGKGVFQMGSGTYTGEFEEKGGIKARHGQGRYEDANGEEIYEGEWKQDAMHGRGVFRSAAGAVYEVSVSEANTALSHVHQRRPRHAGQL